MGKLDLQPFERLLPPNEVRQLDESHESDTSLSSQCDKDICQAAIYRIHLRLQLEERFIASSS